MSPWKAAIVGGVAAVVMQAVTLALERLADRRRRRRRSRSPRAGHLGNARGRAPRRRRRVPGRRRAASSRSASSSSASATCFVWAFGARLRRPVADQSPLPVPHRPGRASSPASTSPSTAPAPRSPICSRTWTSTGEAATSPGRFASSRTPRSARSRPSTTASSRRSGAGPTRCSCSAARPPRRTSRPRSRTRSRVALDEVCRFTGWPIGHAFLVSRDDPERAGLDRHLAASSDEERYSAFRAATESRARSAPAAAFPASRSRRGKPVFVSSDDLSGDRPTRRR